MLSAAIGSAAAPWQAGVLRAGAWAARGLRVPARNALLADIVSPDVYGQAYGFERAMDNLGAIGGPLLAIGLFYVHGKAAVGFDFTAKERPGPFRAYLVCPLKGYPTKISPRTTGTRCYRHTPSGGPRAPVK